MSPRIASLFSGTGALDLAVQAVFGGEVIWHCQYEPPDKNGREDKNQYAAKILARHWPSVPNLWDITKVCWQCVLEAYGLVDILTGGFPCTDVSTAGKRAGLTPDTRSGLWSHMARAIHILQPRLVIIENVEGLLSSKADRGLESGAEALDPDAGAGGVLRALGAVLGDLATLGFHAEWQVVAASAVGAPHQRKRVIIYAWPAALDPRRFGWGNGPGIVGGLGTEGRDTEAAADTADLGHERGGDARRRGHGPADGSVSTAHTCGQGLEVGRVEPDRHELPATERRRRELPAVADEPACPTCGCGEWMHDAGGFCAGCQRCTDPELGRPGEAATNASSVESERRGVAGVLGSQAAAEPRQGDQRERAGHTAGDRGETPADAQGDGRNEGRPEPARQQGRPDAAERGGAPPADPDDLRRRQDVLDLRPGQPDLDWGDYGPAIRRWEQVLGRPAPWPTDALGRLSPVFTEWLMGLPDGWVTATPGLTRPAMLRALGNGVVPQQAVAALHMLHARACEDTTEAAA